MENEMLDLVMKSNFAACNAIRAGKLAEAERWSRIAQRYVDIITKLRRQRAKASP